MGLIQSLDVFSLFSARIFENALATRINFERSMNCPTPMGKRTVGVRPNSY